jgi:DNA-binding IclR family transcriptional regulator
METAMALARKIAEATGEAVNVSVAGATSMMTVGTAESTHPLRVSIPVGSADPFHSTAVGKVYLATLSTEAASAVLASLVLDARTAHTMTSVDALERDLDGVRARGYATNIGEDYEGVSAFAIPLDLVDPIGRRLIVSLTAPSSRWKGKALENNVKIVTQILGDHRYAITPR